MSSQPRFHALLPVRDEADIVGQCLRHLPGWADAVHVLDTGSGDPTWDIVADTAARDPRISPLAREGELTRLLAGPALRPGSPDDRLRRRRHVERHFGWQALRPGYAAMFREAARRPLPEAAT